MKPAPVDEVVVRAQGPVAPQDHAYAHDKIARLSTLTRVPVLFAKVDLIAHANPAQEHPALAKAELDLDGHVLRGHAAAETVHSAVDLLEAKLRRRLERRAGRPASEHLRHRDADTSWHHGDPDRASVPYFPRPGEEREIVRRKSFATEALTPTDARSNLEQLDHDFYLFKNSATGEDNVIHRVGLTQFELLAPTAAPGGDADPDIRPGSFPVHSMTIEDAIDVLTLGDEPFVFFLDPGTQRGQVLYHRYDGHYGLITSS
jgi:ribosome-associated translation inhibitor RaiA